jgi:diadenosine tetraphosphate (Ap4A) HIT family hydrolase
VTDCALCQEDGGLVLVRQLDWRLVRAIDTPAFPAFYRVIWQAHVAEWTDLNPEQRQRCMAVVEQVEALMRQHLEPTKINLASLGNVVPHLHWHVIARYDWDSHFPAPIWAQGQRPIDETKRAALQTQLPVLDAAMQAQWA